MYVLTNGDGYVFHQYDGTHVLHEDNLPEVLQNLRESAADDFRFFIYRLIPADDEFIQASLPDYQGSHPK